MVMIKPWFMQGYFCSKFEYQFHWLAKTMPVWLLVAAYVFIALLLFASNLVSDYQGFIDGCRSYPYAFMAAVRAAIELVYIDEGLFFGFIGYIFQLLLMPVLISMVVMGVTRKNDLDSHHVGHVGTSDEIDIRE